MANQRDASIVRGQAPAVTPEASRLTRGTRTGRCRLTGGRQRRW